MRVPFQLEIQPGKSVTVEQAEVRHLRAIKRNGSNHEKGGATFVSYYIKNSDKGGRIYTGIAACCEVDNFGRAFGRRLAELRAINNYRVRNGILPLDENDLLDIVEIEKELSICKGKLDRIKPTEFNEQKIEGLAYAVEAREEELESLWK